jgi:hypothetical protein
VSASKRSVSAERARRMPSISSFWCTRERRGRAEQKVACQRSQST